MSRILPVSLLTGLLLTGGAATDPADLVRQGNAALARQQPDAALAAYDRAEERSTDPGQVAFNKAVAYYHKGDLAQAEHHFRLARVDAAGPRRATVLYNLAVCLVKQAGERDVARLAEAVALTEGCLSDGNLDSALVANARHNLELAKALWLQARARAAERPKEPPANEEGPPPKPAGGNDEPPPPEPGPGKPRPTTEKRAGPKEPGDLAKSGREQPEAGKGERSAIPDQGEMVPMTEQEARDHLNQAIRKVLEERQAHRQRAVKPPAGKVRDW